jgi:hypothetical protein
MHIFQRIFEFVLAFDEAVLIHAGITDRLTLHVGPVATIGRLRVRATRVSLNRKEREIATLAGIQVSGEAVALRGARCSVDD